MASPVRTTRSFDPADQFPQFRSLVDVGVVDVDSKQSLASVCDDHIEERRSGDVAEVIRMNLRDSRRKGGGRAFDSEVSSG